MYQSNSVSVIIPCLNEEQWLKRILPQAFSFVDEIIVVDNGSKDNSVKVASEHGKNVVVVEEKNLGYGNALKKGLLTAKSDFILAIDGDGSYLAKDLELLTSEMIKDNLEFVWGSRFPLRNKKSLPFINLIGNKVLTFLTNLLFGFKFKDSQSGMWGIRKKALDRLNLTQSGMAFSEEIKIEAIKNGLNNKEIPIDYKERVGKSKLSIFKDGFRNLSFLFKKYFSYFSNRKKIFIKVVYVWLFYFLVLSVFKNIGNGLSDPDAFFHMGLSREISKQGFDLFRNIPWFSFAPGFMDSNFLYHFIFSLFVNFNLVAVYKTLGLIIASTLITVFFFVLNKSQVKYSFLWALILISSSAFFYRLFLFRPFLTSIILIILSFYFASQNKLLKLFIVSIIYPLFYVIPFSILIALFSMLVDFLKKQKLRWNLFFITISGTVLGLLFNPTFPKNISFIYVQIFKTPVVHKAAELMPLDFSSLITQNILVWVIFYGLLSIFIYHRQDLKKFKERVSVEGLAASLLSIFFFVLTIRSQRFVEYWVPFTVLAGALLARDFEFDTKFTKWFKDTWETTSLKILLPIFAFLMLISLIFVNSFVNNYISLKNTDPFDRFKSSSSWLIKNTPEKSIIYNVAWDESPELFFWNTHNYYIVGMDPTFLYEYDKSLYKKYQDIYEGKDNRPSETVKIYFNSSFIFAGKNNQNFINVADKDISLEKVYEDSWAIIYKIRD